MAMAAISLIANPGSASRKYALYRGSVCLASLHFEHEGTKGSRVVCSFTKGAQTKELEVQLDDINQAAAIVVDIFRDRQVLPSHETIDQVGLRIVAPSEFFLYDHVVTDDVVKKLEAVESRAPLHIAATLQELRTLVKQFPTARIVGLSDSAFHITKPDYAWNYGIRLQDADRYDVKRFGYHGLSAGSVVHALHQAEKLPPKLIVCHLGSGASVHAIAHGKSVETTMGYSPLEGLIMATRVGTIDPTAVKAMQALLHLDDDSMQDYLNHHSGLLGLSGRSSDIRELLRFEAEGDHHAALALNTYVHSVQKAIGQMMAVLGGADMLVFTGTVGERSAPIRERVTANLHFMDFFIDKRVNKQCDGTQGVCCVSQLAHSRPIFVVPADESGEMIRRMTKV